MVNIKKYIINVQREDTQNQIRKYDQKRYKKEGKERIKIKIYLKYNYFFLVRTY